MLYSEEVYPWVYGKKALTTKKYNQPLLSNLFQKVKKETLKWSRMEVGTRKIPSAIQKQTNSEDIYANPVPSDEERNQQIREEKLSLLLSSEIKSPA